MKIFKEIKRRARNVALAAMGKGAGWQEKLEPVKIKIESPLKIELFAAEQFIGLQVDEIVSPERVMDFYRRSLAGEIGRRLLEEGALIEEITQQPHELGLRGYTMRLTAKVVVSEEKEAKP